MPIRVLLLVLALLLPATQALAWQPGRYFTHKNWIAVTEKDAKGQRLCLARTGGDGRDNLVVRVAAGSSEPVSVRWRQFWMEGITPIPARRSGAFLVDGTRFPAKSRIAKIPGQGPRGGDLIVPTLDAPAERRRELLAAMHRGRHLTVLLPGGARQEFSLNGFTAALLWAGDQCGRDLMPLLRKR